MTGFAEGGMQSNKSDIQCPVSNLIKAYGAKQEMNDLFSPLWLQDWLDSFFTDNGGLQWRGPLLPFLRAPPKQAKVVEAPGLSLQ